MATFSVGYGGYAIIAWNKSSLLELDEASLVRNTNDILGKQYLFLTSGNIDVQYTRPTQKTYKNPTKTTNIYQLVTGVGICNISGSLSFDMTKSNINYIIDSDIISRNTYFSLLLSDGNSKYFVSHCVWNSISISAQAGSLVSCSIGYTALNGRTTDISQNNSTNLNIDPYFQKSLVAYWQVGAGNHIESFSLNFSQQVTPVYLNNGFITPTYLRCGMIGINASFQSWIDWQDINEIVIGNKLIKFNNKAINKRQFSMGGAADVGKHSYQITGYAVKKSEQKIFEISSIN